EKSFNIKMKIHGFYKILTTTLLFFLNAVGIVALPPQSPPKQQSHPADAFVSTQPLGALYTKTETTFRVFAPTAGSLHLRLYQSPTGGQAKVLEMKKNDDGTWETTVTGDCLGLYYTLTAAGDAASFQPDLELIDPYSRAVTAYNGRSIIVND